MKRSISSHRSSQGVVESHPFTISSIFFCYLYDSLYPAFPPPGMFLSFISSSFFRTCMCLLCFFFFFSAIVTMPLPDAHKMGLSGKTFAPHISHKGSLWPITVLMEARDSHQLHAFFSSHAWTLAKAQLALSVWCCLWQWHHRCPEKWHIVAHFRPYYKRQQAKGLNYTEGTTHVPLLSEALKKKWIVGIARILKHPIICLTFPRIIGQPLISLCKGLSGTHVNGQLCLSFSL